MALSVETRSSPSSPVSDLPCLYVALCLYIHFLTFLRLYLGMISVILLKIWIHSYTMREILKIWIHSYTRRKIPILHFCCPLFVWVVFIFSKNNSETFVLESAFLNCSLVSALFWFSLSSFILFFCF